jgi:hypothetical protein
MKTAYYSINVYKENLTVSWLAKELVEVSDMLNSASDINIIDHGNEWKFVITHQVQMSNEERLAKTIQYYKLKQELGL